MKKIAYSIVLTIGFLLVTSESATFTPNFIGLSMFFLAAYKLNIFSDQRTGTEP